MDKQSLYLHGFNLLPGFGHSRLFKLHLHFPSPEEAFHASAAELEKAGIEPEVAEKFLAHRQQLSLEREAEKLASEQIRLLNYSDERYPRLLKEISKYPLLLYYKGDMGDAEELCIAVVGTRNITNYGRTVAPYLVEPLVDRGVTLVSGLAYGVDSQMQKLAAHKGKRTIAVVGGGLDSRSFYPKEHQLLADEIVSNGGAILSEYPPGTPPLKHHFIARNRIISGLSVATLIIECGLKSGSLITAQYALEQNRTVFAVPGPIYAEQSKGPNNLIKMGAKLVTDAADILQDLNLTSLPQQQQMEELFELSGLETEILAVLGFDPLNINEVIKKLAQDAGEVSSALTLLEMKGKVKNLGAQQYVRTR